MTRLAPKVKYVPERQVASLRKDLSPSDFFNAKNEARRTVIQIVGAIGIAASIYFGIQTLQTTQQGQQATQATQEKNLQLAEQTLRGAREGEIANRFAQANQNLGSDKQEHHLGAIYALESIAKDSEQYYWPVMEVLTAFLRQHAPYREREESPFYKNLLEPLQEEMGVEPQATPSPVTPPVMASNIEIEAVLGVLKRRNWMNEGREGRRLDLRGTNLAKADFRDIHLEGVDLSGANLEKANFMGAKLTGANFERAYLNEACFVMADLEDANLSDTLLTRGYFSQANLRGVSFRMTVLERAMLAGVNLDEANFGAANLKDAFFGSADLRKANIKWEQLEQTGYLDEKLRVPPELEGLLQAKLQARKEYLKKLGL